MSRLCFIFTLFLLSIAERICRNLEFENATIRSTLDLFQEKQMTASDMLMCTQNWLYSDSELKDIGIDKSSRSAAKDMDKGLNAFGARSLSLQGIPVLVDYNTWKASSSLVLNDEKNPVQSMLNKMGAISIVLDEAKSFGKILKAISKKTILLGLTLEDTPTLNLKCVGLLCLKFSETKVGIKKYSSDLGPTLGLVTSNISDMHDAVTAVLTRIERRTGPVPEHISNKASKTYKDIFNMRIAIVSINSTDVRQPIFGPMISAVNRLRIHLKPVVLEGGAVTDGIFSSKKAVIETQLRSEISGSNELDDNIIFNRKKHRNSENINIYEVLKPGTPVEILEKRSTSSVDDYNPDHSPWLRVVARQILNDLLDFDTYHVFATPCHHLELLKIVELAGYPSITIPARQDSKSESLTLVSLYYDERGLVNLASAILKDPAYIDYSY